MSFSGSIAVGKSTLARHVAHQLEGARLIPEDLGRHRFLAPFYADPARYAFHSRVEFLSLKARQLQRDVAAAVALYDRSLPELITFARVLRDRSMLSEDEFALYADLYDLLLATNPPLSAIVWVRCPPAQSLERSARRGRDFERGIDLDYLVALDDAYAQWTASLPPEELLVVDTAGDRAPEDLAADVSTWLAARAG